MVPRPTEPSDDNFLSSISLHLATVPLPVGGASGSAGVPVNEDESYEGVGALLVLYTSLQIAFLKLEIHIGIGMYWYCQNCQTNAFPYQTPSTYSKTFEFAV